MIQRHSTIPVINPAVSVVMSVYDGEQYLAQAIESILNQTFTDFEFLIINDGSTDNTKKIIESYTDSRIVLINQENMGLTKSLNKGIRLSKGKYIARMDADDISEANRFKTQFEFMESNSDVAVCGCWAKTFGVTENVWRYPTTHDEICSRQLFTNTVVHSSAMIRNSALKKSGILYDEKHLRSQDYDFWVRLSRKYKIANINRVLLFLRIHQLNTGTIHNRDQKKSANQIRNNQLIELGLKVSEEALGLHSKISKKDYECTRIFIRDAQNWLELLLKANENKKLFNNITFKKELASHWWSICRSSTKLGLFSYFSFQRSELHKYINLSYKLKIIFFIKCMMRYD